MIVVDANLLVTMASGDVRGNRVIEKFSEWLDNNNALHAPLLAQYEVLNALTRLVARRFLSSETVYDAWNNLSLLPIQYHSVSNAQRIIKIALMLRRQTAYDAAYLALAEELEAEVWTLDGHLYRNAIVSGLPVRLLD